MKKFLLLLALVPSFALAQNQGELMGLGGGGEKIFCRVNEDLADLASSDERANYIACNKAGALILGSSGGVGDFGAEMSLTPLIVGTDTAETSSTTTVINATSHAARVNDYIKFTAGTAANVEVWRKVSEVAANTITVSVAFPSAPANGDAFVIYRPVPNASVYAEDTGHVTGDYGIAVLGIRNETAAVSSDTQGDYTGIATNRYGAVNVVLDTNLVNSAVIGTQPVRAEDSPFADTNAVMMAGARYLGNNAFAASAGTANDVATFDLDVDGRLAVNAFGANTTNWWQGCSSAATDTSNVAIKAASGSGVRTYVTNVSCANTANVASTILFKDGTTQIYIGGISSSSLAGVGYYEHTFGVPLRGTANTAFNFSMGTTATNTVCCATGYTSVN